MHPAFTILDVLLEMGFRIGLWISFLWMDKLPPIIRHIDEDELWYYRYPSVDSYFPKRYLYCVIFGIPAIILILQYIINRKSQSALADITNTAYGLSLTYCINGIFTALLKLTIGRPRPNFYLRCFPDGTGTDLDHCNGEYHGQMDGRKSFPSGHASFAFASMLYMVLHLSKILDIKKPRFCRGFILFLMSLLLLLASLIAVSRTADYHHHYSDVIGGAVLGSIIAVVMQSVYSELNQTEEDMLIEALGKLSRAPSLS